MTNDISLGLHDGSNRFKKKGRKEKKYFRFQKASNSQYGLVINEII